MNSSKSGDFDYLVLHNSASPNTDRATLLACLQSARNGRVAQAFIPETRTQFLKKGVLAEKMLPRQQVATACDPTVFPAKTLRAVLQAQAERKIASDTTTDLAMELGYDVELVESQPGNLKITGPWDLATLSAAMAKKQNENSEAAANTNPGKRPPLLSIGLPVCNGENYLARALESILAQDFENFELIICDNASSDNTEEICRNYQNRDSRIRYYRNTENIGAAPNFNRTLELARGELFKWAAHDDLLAPGYLRRCVDTLLAQPNAVLCHSLVTIIDADDRPIATYDSELIGAASARVDERLAALILNRHLCTDMFGVMRTAALRSSQQHGAYYGGDRAMLAEMSLLGRFLKVPEPLFLNREHPERFVRAVSPSQWQSWHTGAAASRMANPTWRLFCDYRDAVARHVQDPAERRRCQSVLRRWWLVDWNIGRLLIDISPDRRSRSPRLGSLAEIAALWKAPTGSRASSRRTAARQCCTTSQSNLYRRLGSQR